MEILKDNMNTLLVVALLFGIAYLAFFYKSKDVSAPEILQWFSSQLSKISENLADDIELDRKGHYLHEGKQSFEPRGRITYTLLDKNLSRYELSQFTQLTMRDIESTPGYQELKATVAGMGLNLELEEVEVAGDGVETWHELDEYVYDFPRYYTVTVSGWSD